MERGRLIVALEQKAVTSAGSGEISGLASVYGNVDLQDDIMERGALDRSIANHQGKAAAKIPLLDWHGDSLGRLIGSARELKSVPQGVWFNAGFSATPEAQRARQLAQEGHLSGVSIGYLPIRQSFKSVGGRDVRLLHEVRLLEISLTPVPANPLAQVASVKAAMSSASINDLPDSAFAYIQPGGTKDAEGKTVPRSLRHFPVHDADHVRNALSRAPQSPFGDQAMPKIRAAAAKLGIKVSEAASLSYGQFADAMRVILQVPFEPARKAAADVLLDEYQYLTDEPEDEAPGMADEPDPTADGPAADPPAEGGPDGTPDDAGITPREYADMIANRGSTDGSPASLDRLETEIRQALEGTSQ